MKRRKERRRAAEKRPTGIALPARRAPLSWKGWLLVVLACAVAAGLFSSGALDLSRQMGRLSTVSNYDDVSYLDKASDAYFVMKEEGGGAAARRLFTANLHSPFAVFLAFAGHVVFGPQVDGIYRSLSLVVLAYLLGLAALWRRLPSVVLAACLAAALAVPFATLSALEFRPDQMWAVVVGAAGVLFLAADRPFGTWIPSALFGTALGASLLVKPSTALLALLTLGGTWLLAAAIAVAAGGEEPRRVAHGLLVTAGAAALVSAWYLVPHGKAIYAYFYDNSFGKDREIWAYQGDLRDLLLFYVRDGVARQSNLGAFFWPAAGLVAVASLRDLVGSDRRARFRAAALLWMLAGLFLVTGLFTMKSPYLGAAFYGYLLFGAAWALGRLADEPLRSWFRRPVARVVLGGLLVFGAWSVRSFPPACALNPEAAANQKAVNGSLVADLLARTAGREQTALFTQGNPVVPEYLAMEFRVAGKRLKGRSGAMVGSLPGMLEMARDVRFVLVQDPGIVGAPGDRLPGETVQKELLSWFSASPEWTLASSYPLSRDKNVYLFERRDPLP